jgi:hypothetical protein
LGLLLARYDQPSTDEVDGSRSRHLGAKV